MEIDGAFIKRVYRTSAFVWAFGVPAAWCVAGPLAAIGWTLGSGVSFGILWSLEWIVRRVFVPGAVGARRDLARFSILKLVALAVVLIGVVGLGGRSFSLIVGFCAGVVLTQAVIFLKVVGKLICNYSNDSRAGGVR